MSTPESRPVRPAGIVSVASEVTVLSSPHDPAGRPSPAGGAPTPEDLRWQLALEVLAREVGLALALIDRDHRIVECNDAMTELAAAAGVSLGAGTAGELLPGAAARVEGLVDEVFESGEPVRDVELPEAPDETGTTGTGEEETQARRIWLASFQPIGRAPAGEVEAVLVLLRDVSEARRLERRFETGAERLRRTLETPYVGIAFSGIDGSIKQANDAFLHLAGVEREDLEAGRLDWRRMRSPEQWKTDRRCFEEMLTLGRIRPYETRLLRPDGSEVPVLLSGTLLANDLDEHVVFVVDSRESEAVHGAFAAVDRREERFLVTLACELRRSLDALREALDLLTRPGLDPVTMRRGHRAIRRQIEGLERLHRDLLDLARLDGEGIRLRPETLVPAHVAARAAEALQARARDRGVEIVVDVPGTWRPCGPIRRGWSRSSSTC